MILHRARSEHHRMTVGDERGRRVLRFDGVAQSAAHPDGRSALPYLDYLHLALAVRPRARSALVVGLGGGVLPARMRADYPDMRVDVVELDPEVVRLARRYFGLETDDRLQVHVAEGRDFLDRAPARWEALVLDAYFADALPYRLFTVEGLRVARERLVPGGVVAANVVGTVAGPGSRTFRSVYKTVRKVWPTVHVFPVGFGRFGEVELRGNIVLLATDRRLPPDRLLDAIEGRAGGRVKVRQFPGFGADLHVAGIDTRDVPVLRDADAPADGLLPV